MFAPAGLQTGDGGLGCADPGGNFRLGYSGGGAGLKREGKNFRSGIHSSRPFRLSWLVPDQITDPRYVDSLGAFF